MNVHVLTGFLGSGKTTAIRQACLSLMKEGERVAVITNDQGFQLVDAFVFRKLEIPERQVGGGCFCCNFFELEEQVQSLAAALRPTVIFAESVGTCTDIIATVIKPLQQLAHITHLSLTTVLDARLLSLLLEDDKKFSPEVRYIYFKQVEEGQVLLLNKTDLIADHVLISLMDELRHRFPGKPIICQDSTAAVSKSAWMHYLQTNRLNLPMTSLGIDYDRYATGEALMGFLDQHVRIQSEVSAAKAAAVYLMQCFIKRVKSDHVPIGHIKCWFDGQAKYSVTAGNEDSFPVQIAEDGPTCELVISARVQTDPKKLYEHMLSAIEKSSCQFHVNIEILNSSYFKPAYPRPTYRVA